MATEQYTVAASAGDAVLLTVHNQAPISCSTAVATDSANLLPSGMASSSHVLHACKEHAHMEASTVLQ